MSDSDTATTATIYGTRDGFDDDSFVFSDDVTIPLAYVVAYGMAHLRGPAGSL